MSVSYRSDPTIGQSSQTGDRGIPPLFKNDDGNYQVPLVTTSGGLQIAQNVVADTNNSSSTNLDTPTYTFTGTKSSTLGVAGIQVSLFANKNCIVKVQQSPEGTNWDITDQYTYPANGSFGITVQAVSSYVRVVVSTANETTTTFRLQTALCPIVEAVPRSLDSNGNFKVAMGIDEYGFSAENTPMGDQRMVEPYRLAGTTFEGTTIDGNFWTTAATGTSAAIAQANAQLLLTSGTSNAAAVSAYTVRRARYVGGSSMRYRAVVQLGDTGTASNKRRWGIAYGGTMPTLTDGAWFQINGTSFSVVTAKNGVGETSVTTFNGSLGPSYSPTTNATTYEIYWTNSKVYFVVGGELLHTVSAGASSWSTTMNFHAFMDSLNSGVLADSVTMAVRTATIYRLGRAETSPFAKNITGVATTQVIKYSPGLLHRIVLGTPVNGKTISVYDNVSGTGNPILILTLPAQATPFTMECGIPFYAGLNVVPNDTGLNFTVVYE